ncbi:ATP-binding cassette domain-containing protein [Streptomyces monashensis]|uniref:ABC transporter n=1 Tax=Streptomyces monashensis TaxID=1678012 RepID=A0A1S2QGI8_9ACTN|nr:ATP-binding cassette domain-containing protein [Streptomyces monashensis]OIK05269.1 ABC transporter [Streptomyces monashensis]
MRRAAISVSGLRKAYGGRLVLDGVGFGVAEGSVFALLGPKGAGKTTTVDVLTTLTRPDAGTVRVAGHDVLTATRQVRAAVGATGRPAAVDDLLTGRENLRVVADRKRVPCGDRAVARLLERFDLVESADRPAAACCGGVRRRLELAMTLVGDPRIVFLDEPTTGLDPRARHAMWGIVRELVADGTTVFLTTRYLEEADQLADQIAVLGRGRVVARGTPEELRRRISGTHVRLRFADLYELDAAARVLAGSTRNDAELTLRVRVPGDAESGAALALLTRLDEHGIGAREFSVHSPDLDDIVLALTGERGTGHGEAAARRSGDGRA